MQPVSLKSALKRALKKSDIYTIYLRQRALVMWEQVCGKEVAQVSTPLKLAGGVLFVAVKDHIWATEIANFKQEYIERFRKLFHSNIITDIRFLADPSAFKKSRKKSPDEFDPETVELTGKDKKKIENLLSELKDEKTRDLIKSLLIQKVKYDRWLKKHGGGECFHCGIVIEKKNSFCPHCLRELERKNIDKLRYMLENYPWSSFNDVVKEVNPISLELYDKIKKEMIEDLSWKIIDSLEQIKDRKKRQKISAPRRAPALKSKIITLAMLLSGKKPSELVDEVLRKTLSTQMYEFLMDTTTPGN